MKKILLIVALCFGLLKTFAQSNSDEQMLIFRNTGEVNLFYIDEIDSIATSKTDSLGVEHEKVVSQIFFAKDTTLIVPIAEIDSVTFGNHNEIIIKPDVKHLSEGDCKWIIRYDGEYIYYKSSTPNNILPKIGDKLFYNNMDDLFPIGLIAKVCSVELKNGEYAVGVVDVELKDVFDKLFYAGPISSNTSNNTSSNKAPILNNEIKVGLPLGDYGQVFGTYNVNIDGNVVANPLKGYFHFDATVTTIMATGFKAKAESKLDLEITDDIIDVPLGRYALVFTPTLKLGSFINLNAEISSDIMMSRTVANYVSYTRFSDNDVIFTVTSSAISEPKTNSSIEMICSGEVYTGLYSTFDFNILKETAGARLKMRFGPSFRGELSIGSLVETSKNYNSELYGSAELDFGMRLNSVGSIYFRNLVWGEENETVIYENNFDFLLNYMTKI